MIASSPPLPPPRVLLPPGGLGGGDPLRLAVAFFGVEGLSGVALGEGLVAVGLSVSDVAALAVAGLADVEREVAVLPVDGSEVEDALLEEAVSEEVAEREAAGADAA